LFVHLVFFLLEYNKTIKGYAKSDIFDWAILTADSREVNRQ
jgi:hypothetical protein